MDRRILYRMSVVQKVAEVGTFTRAADELNLSKSVVSQHVRDLESELKVRLLNRSTRSTSLTQEGMQLAEAAGKMMKIVESALQALEHEQVRPSGLIRITASQNFWFTFTYASHHSVRFR